MIKGDGNDDGGCGCDGDGIEDDGDDDDCVDGSDSGSHDGRGSLMYCACTILIFVL